MVEARLAIERAVEFLKELYPKWADGLRLEQIEMSQDAPFWEVTLSFPDPEIGLALVLPGTPRPRIYKTVLISTVNGEPSGMRIYKL